MFADLIAVEGDPLANLDTLRNIVFVMKNGMVFYLVVLVVPE